jgi:hypothetical protein
MAGKPESCRRPASVVAPTTMAFLVIVKYIKVEGLTQASAVHSCRSWG